MNFAPVRLRSPDSDVQNFLFTAPEGEVDAARARLPARAVALVHLESCVEGLR